MLLYYFKTLISVKKMILIILFLSCLTNSFSQKRNINIVVDERTELITITQLLFGYPLVGRTDINYKNDIQNYFKKYENDTTVSYLLEVTEHNFSFTKPFQFTYHYSFPDFKQKYDFTGQEVKDLDYGNRKETLLLYNTNLKEFYDKTQFHNFYKNHQLFYDSITTQVKSAIDKYNLVETLEKHYGWKQHSYNLVISPLSIEAGMSIRIKTLKGYDSYAIVGPKYDSKVTPVFDVKNMMEGLIIHEFSHAFCNPLIDEYYSRLERDSSLFDSLKSDLHKQACDNWKDALCEFFTRANEIIFDRAIIWKG